MSRNRPHQAFTLVELLTVIVIIGMLVALLIPAIGAVMRRTKDFRTATDIAKLEQAVELYKDKYGDYPPDFSEMVNYHDGNSDNILRAVFDSTAIIGHLRRAFPKISPIEVSHFKNYLKQEIDNDRRPTPPHSIFFWLGGLSGNVQRPFTGAGGPLIVLDAGSYRLRIVERTNPIFEFEDSKLVVNDEQQPTSAVLVPKGLKVPLVYFNSKTYLVSVRVGRGYIHRPACFQCSHNNLAIPYKSTTRNPNSTTDDQLFFAKRNSFQIISAGVDNIYCLPIPMNRYYVYTTENGRPYHPTEPLTDPRIAGFFEGQEDNLTNFSEGKRLVALQE